ncbi:unnamed protein product, partial [Brassica rapa subsp. trilocularis]
FSFSFAETTPKVKFSPTLPSPISDSSFSVTTFGSHGRLQFQTPNPISSSCLLLSTNPNSTPPPSIPRNLNSNTILVFFIQKSLFLYKTTMTIDTFTDFEGLDNQIITPLRMKLAADIYKEVTETAE